MYKAWCFNVVSETNACNSLIKKYNALRKCFVLRKSLSSLFSFAQELFGPDIIQPSAQTYPFVILLQRLQGRQWDNTVVQ